MSFPLKLVKTNTKLDFIGKRYIMYFLSLAISLLTIVFFFTKGLNFGIDFTGGVILEIKPQQEISIDDFREGLENSGYSGASIQNDNKGILMVRVQPKDIGSYSKEIEDIKSVIQKITGNVDFRRIDYVGPKVGGSLIFKGVISISLALLAIMIYVWIRFDFRFGVGVIIALFHDIIATTGFYIVSGYEFDLTSIAAILTIIGYSVNDSVVIYDRIRENMRKRGQKNIVQLINDSINETLSRTIMTAVTTIAVCAALVFFGGQAIKGFSAAMLFGVAFGTYSSICISAPILLLFIGKKVDQ